MKRLFKIIIILFVVIIVAGSFWLSLDKRTRFCLVYGKNICNFYTMMDIIPSIENFDEMMNLCKDMYDVPKKDGCFQFISQAFVQIDIDKAKEACNQIKGFGGVNSKERCYELIEK